MAAGDRIGIADKATLDNVKNTLDGVNNRVINLENRVSPREYYIAADLITDRKLIIDRGTLPADSTMTTVVSITGKGRLYLALLDAGSDGTNINENYIDIQVDGLYVCTRQVSTNTATSTPLGILTQQGKLINTDNKLLVYGSLINISNTSLDVPSTSVVSSPSLVYLPLPLKFNSNLTIRGRASTSARFLYYMYELD